MSDALSIILIVDDEPINCRLLEVMRGSEYEVHHAISSLKTFIIAEQHRLGLAIRRRIAELMGGDIVVESTLGAHGDTTLCIHPQS